MKNGEGINATEYHASQRTLSPTLLSICDWTHTSREYADLILSMTVQSTTAKPYTHISYPLTISAHAGDPD